MYELFRVPYTNSKKRLILKELLRRNAIPKKFDVDIKKSIN
jgi:hypothetical protein